MGVFLCQGNLNETLISKVKRIEISKSNYPRSVATWDNEHIYISKSYAMFEAQVELSQERSDEGCGCLCMSKKRFPHGNP